MKIINYFSIAILSISLASCGGEKKSNDNAEINVKSGDSEVSEYMGNTSAYEENEEYYSSSDENDSYYDDNDSYYDDNENSNLNSSSGSQDWDALLNSYEQYVDKYISYIKKAAKGDMSAMAEYPALMEKAQEFSEKMANAQGDMSASQWARYMKITNKVTEAAKNMQSQINSVENTKSYSSGDDDESYSSEDDDENYSSEDDEEDYDW